MIKRVSCIMIASIFLLLMFLGAKVQAPKTNNVTQLKKQIGLLQIQLKEKITIINKLQKENKSYKNQIAEFPKEIEKVKAMVAASSVTSMPPLFDAIQAPLQHIFIDGGDFTLDTDMNKFVRVNRYDGKELMNNNIYLPMDVVGQILNKTFEWDSKSNSLYFGKKSPEDSSGQ